MYFFAYFTALKLAIHAKIDTRIELLGLYDQKHLQLLLLVDKASTIHWQDALLIPESVTVLSAQATSLA